MRVRAQTTDADADADADADGKLWMILQLLMGPTNEENILLDADVDVDARGGWEAHLLDKEGPILEIPPRIIVLGSLLLYSVCSLRDVFSVCIYHLVV